MLFFGLLSREGGSGKVGAPSAFRFLGPGEATEGRPKGKSCNTVYCDIPPELRVLIEPIVEANGFELVDVTLRRGRPPWLVRITIDTPAGDGRVPVDRCAAVSREVGTHLDAEDAIERSYNLEVTSPGLDRVLAREKDFTAACGYEVSLETRRPLEGRRRFRGRLEEFADGVARLRIDGRAFEVPFGEVARGHRIYDITSADFASVSRAGAKKVR
jgi:ribosome maturation factor RimP